jgi:hypothetical protein
VRYLTVGVIQITEGYGMRRTGLGTGGYDFRPNLLAFLYGLVYAVETESALFNHPAYPLRERPDAFVGSV